MFDENEEENEKKKSKNERTKKAHHALKRARRHILYFNCIFKCVRARGGERQRRLKIEPVFILMLSVYYYYIINIFNAFTTSTISKISNYSLSVRANSKTFARSFLVSSLRSI